MFHAVIAFAGTHLGRTRAPSVQRKAEEHHAECVKLLISLSDESLRALDGIALAAVCLLRSHEILAEDLDPNRHLRGAYALAASPSLDPTAPSLFRAGFFNYLREDITFSLITRQPLKLGSSKLSIHYSAATDEDQLNLAALHLARIVNAAFTEAPADEDAMLMEQQLDQWHGSLPSTFLPYHDSGLHAGTPFPCIRMLAECHAAVAHYYLVAKSVITSCRGESAEAGMDLQRWAIRLCGIAFSCDSPAVTVNWFGPISFCGRFLLEKPLRAELLRKMQSFQKGTGWPVQRFTDDLQAHWDSTAHDL